MFSKQQLEALKYQGDVDYSELRELNEIIINTDEPIEQRIDDYFQQIKNPYHFLINGKEIRLSYGSENRTLEQCLHNYAIKKNNMTNTTL